MEEKVFLDAARPPAEPDLQSALRDAYTWYQKIMAQAGAYSQAWAFTKSSGWMLKVFDRNKALFYLIPWKNGFMTRLTLRENERAIFLQDEELAGLRPELQTSKKYSEGYVMQFCITAEGAFQIFALFLDKLIAVRS
jgi:hypothetical protein